MRRPVLPGDVAAAARALLAAPEPSRAALCAQIFANAAEADIYRRRTGRLHPRLGDGSLSAAARRHKLADEPFCDDADYLSCTLRVLQAVAAGLTPARS
ncbi:DUF7742 family protein [Roseobacteraceae bacterium NS-SX3]